MTSIREAILKAADHIEANPEHFSYGSTDNPACGVPGCALGWIGAYLGIEEPWWRSGKFYAVMGLPYDFELGTQGDWVFYRRMDDLTGSDMWKLNSNLCTHGLRAYADKYHPEEFPEVRKELTRIFKETAWTRNSLANT